MDCATPAQRIIGLPGAPGGTLPAGGSQWSFLQFNGTLWVPSSWVMPEVVAAPETGEVLLAAGGGVAEFQVPVENSLLYRNTAQTISATGVWLHQWTYAATASTTRTGSGFAVALLAGNLRWMHVFHAGAPVGADDITYTVVVNGVARGAA